MASLAAPANFLAVVFDAVGTLLFADPPVTDVYHLAGWQFGSRLERDEIGRRLRAAFAACEAGEGLNRPATSEPAERERWQRIVATVFDDVAAPAQSRLFRELWNHFAQPENWRLFDDVPLTLAELARRGYRLAIASNFDRRLHAIRAAHAPLAPCERCFVSSELGFSKPDSRFFSAIEQQLGLASNELLLVGDDETNDVRGARAAGWRMLHLRRKGELSSKREIASLAELLRLL
ncbi:MAG: HAD-IA family hydrolase [Pirellulaceae bacterium]|nr:HAD-IA family hydrolase [Pirellulaceae bacterium]